DFEGLFGSRDGADVETRLARDVATKISRTRFIVHNQYVYRYRALDHCNCICARAQSWTLPELAFPGCRFECKPRTILGNWCKGNAKLHLAHIRWECAPRILAQIGTGNNQDLYGYARTH